MATRTRRAAQAGVALALLALLCSSSNMVAASRQLTQDSYYQAQISTDFSFGVEQFDQAGFKQTISSYFEARVDAMQWEARGPRFGGAYTGSPRARLALLIDRHHSHRGGQRSRNSKRL